MKYKNSILLCEFDDGTVDLFVNGAQVLRGKEVQTPLKRIANCDLTFDRLQQMLHSTHEILNELELPPN